MLVILESGEMWWDDAPMSPDVALSVSEKLESES
jgi:hypothetical protein